MPFADTVVEEIFADNLTHVETMYGYWNGSWTYWFPGIPSTMTEFECGQGYWVLTDDDFNTTITGYTAAKPPLLDGWNLIGVNGTDPVPLEEFFAGDLSKVRYVYGFDNVLKEYTYWIAGVGGTLTTLRPGEGYWVLMESE